MSLGAFPAALSLRLVPVQKLQLVCLLTGDDCAAAMTGKFNNRLREMHEMGLIERIAKRGSYHTYKLTGLGTDLAKHFQESVSPNDARRDSAMQHPNLTLRVCDETEGRLSGSGRG